MNYLRKWYIKVYIELMELIFINPTDIWEHNKVVMCEVFIGEIRELSTAHLPLNLCTHVLFRVKLKNGAITNNVVNGKAYL
jgi:hypothetical protein